MKSGTARGFAKTFIAATANERSTTPAKIARDWLLEVPNGRRVIRAPEPQPRAACADHDRRGAHCPIDAEVLPDAETPVPATLRSRGHRDRSNCRVNKNRRSHLHRAGADLARRAGLAVA